MNTSIGGCARTGARGVTERTCQHPEQPHTVWWFIDLHERGPRMATEDSRASAIEANASAIADAPRHPYHLRWVRVCHVDDGAYECWRWDNPAPLPERFGTPRRPSLLRWLTGRKASHPRSAVLAALDVSDRLARAALLPGGPEHIEPVRLGVIAATDPEAALARNEVVRRVVDEHRSCPPACRTLMELADGYDPAWRSGWHSP